MEIVDSSSLPVDAIEVNMSLAYRHYLEEDGFEEVKECMPNDYFSTEQDNDVHQVTVGMRQTTVKLSYRDMLLDHIKEAEENRQRQKKAAAENAEKKKKAHDWKPTFAVKKTSAKRVDREYGPVKAVAFGKCRMIPRPFRLDELSIVCFPQFVPLIVPLRITSTCSFFIHSIC
jgi:hypothetical protein